jgi:gliding motility-associated-like protein
MSFDFPTTPGVQQETNAGAMDAVIFKMNPSLENMEWGTHWGGLSQDSSYSLEINSQGEVYVVGATLNSDLAMPDDGMDTSFGGATDGYVIKLNEGVLEGGTYIGTSAYDVTFFVELDTQENVWITGQTEGVWEVSDDVYANAGAGQYIQKISSDLTELMLSSTYGDGGGFFSPINICQTAFLIDDCNRIFVSGWGGSLNGFGNTNNMPITPDAFQSTTDGSDFYIVVFEEEMSDLIFGTYFGASTLSEHVDGGTSRFSPKGIIYQAVCAGCGGSDAFPTSAGAWSESNNSANCNMAVFKYDLEIESLVAVASISPEAQGCTPFSVEFDNSGSTGIENNWDFGDGGTSDEDAPEHTYTEPGTYTVTYISIDPESCNLSDTTFLEVYVQDPLVLDASFSLSTELCSDSLRLFALFEGSQEYDQLIWNLGDGNVSSLLEFIHIYDEPGLYNITVTVTDDFCDFEDVEAQEIIIDSNGAIEGEVKFPNVITPNTDLLNRDFRPFIITPDGLRVVPGSIDMPEFFDAYHVKVYNRWGSLLFESSSSTPFWDGEFDGEEVGEGVYYYIVSYKLGCTGGAEIEESGHMTLLRKN